MNAKRSFCLSKHHHGSKSEAEYCNWLLARQQSGEIVKYDVWPSVQLRTIRKTWKIDFKVYENDGTESYHESKGWNRSDDSFKYKRDAFLICYPKLKLYVNKELWTGKPDRKKMKWTMNRVKQINKRVAENTRRARA